MSEFKPRHEQLDHQPIFDPERELPTAEQAEPLRPGEVDPKAISEARETVEHVAPVNEASKIREQLKQTAEQPQPVSSKLVSDDLKQTNTRQAIVRLQRQESLPTRTFSRLVHQPVVRTISAVADKTVSRPSGLLGGGLVAFMGTSAYLYLANHIGFSYNYLVFLLLLAAGFALGLALELLVHLATASRRRAHD
jgi:hypothetical protein